MRNNLFLLLLAPYLLSGCTSHSYRSSAVASLRYDGVYRAETRVDGDLYCEYLRFYPAGTVITVTSECPGNDVLQDIRKWFSSENAGPEANGISKGKTTITGSGITFDAISREGNVGYTGKITGERIRLSSYSHINQHRDDEVYKFLAW
ncbi:MAG: hypothetical protein ACREPB_04435 [Arenimonas sp.]